MRTLFLHVGHMKTGTTYLQSCFIENRNVLRAQDILYPHGGRDEDEIDLDVMTPVGNARHLLKSPRTLLQGLRDVKPAVSGNLLFSSELLFNQIWNRGDLSYIPRTAKQAGFDRVKLLLFVRDPLPLAISIWQQRVKGWFGETARLDDYITQQFDWPARALRLVETLDQTGGIEMELHNHTAVAAQNGLLALCETWLELPQGTLEAPRNEQVNRSMTRSEAELQRLLNIHSGPSGALFAYPVTSRLTEVAKDPPRPDPAVVKAWLIQHKPVMEALQARLPEHEAFQPYVACTDTPEGLLSFTTQQLEILSKAIARATGATPQTTSGRAKSVPMTRRFRRTLKRILGR